MAQRNAQGAGTIRKRSDGRWEARFTMGYDPVTGKQIQKSVYGKTQKEVREKLSKVTAELDEGSYVEPAKQTLGEWLDTWMETYVKYSVKPYTQDCYQRVCDCHIKPALGKVQLSKLTTLQVQKFYNSLQDVEGLCPKTIKNVHGVLHRALKQAVKLGLIPSNPTELCDLPKVHRRELQYLAQDTVSAFLQAIKGHFLEILFLVTLFTGMRQGEVLGLTWDCVDFDHNTILINKQLQKTKKVGGKYVLVSTKNGRSRTVAVAPTVTALLRKQRARQAEMRLMAGPAWDNPWNLVFTNEVGGHLCHRTVIKHYKHIVASIGLPNLRFHDLRHSYAVVSIESGDDIKTLQGNLGHATAAFTLDVYGHVSQRMRQQSAERMEKFIQNVSG